MKVRYKDRNNRNIIQNKLVNNDDIKNDKLFRTLNSNPLIFCSTSHINNFNNNISFNDITFQTSIKKNYDYLLNKNNIFDINTNIKNLISFKKNISKKKQNVKKNLIIDAPNNIVNFSKNNIKNSLEKLSNVSCNYLNNFSEVNNYINNINYKSYMFPEIENKCTSNCSNIYDSKNKETINNNLLLNYDNNISSFNNHIKKITKCKLINYYKNLKAKDLIIDNKNKIQVYSNYLKKLNDIKCVFFSRLDELDCIIKSTISIKIKLRNDLKKLVLKNECLIKSYKTKEIEYVKLKEKVNILNDYENFINFIYCIDIQKINYSVNYTIDIINEYNRKFKNKENKEIYNNDNIYINTLVRNKLQKRSSQDNKIKNSLNKSLRLSNYKDKFKLESSYNNNNNNDDIINTLNTSNNIKNNSFMLNMPLKSNCNNNLKNRELCKSSLVLNNSNSNITTKNSINYLKNNLNILDLNKKNINVNNVNKSNSQLSIFKTKYKLNNVSKLKLFKNNIDSNNKTDQLNILDSTKSLLLEKVNKKSLNKIYDLNKIINKFNTLENLLLNLTKNNILLNQDLIDIKSNIIKLKYQKFGNLYYNISNKFANADKKSTIFSHISTKHKKSIEEKIALYTSKSDSLMLNSNSMKISKLILEIQSLKSRNLLLKDEYKSILSKENTSLEKDTKIISKYKKILNMKEVISEKSLINLIKKHNLNYSHSFIDYNFKNLKLLINKNNKDDTNNYFFVLKFEFICMVKKLCIILLNCKKFDNKKQIIFKNILSFMSLNPKENYLLKNKNEISFDLTFMSYAEFIINEYIDIYNNFKYENKNIYNLKIKQLENSKRQNKIKIEKKVNILKLKKLKYKISNKKLPITLKRNYIFRLKKKGQYRKRSKEYYYTLKKRQEFNNKNSRKTTSFIKYSIDNNKITNSINIKLKKTTNLKNIFKEFVIRNTIKNDFNNNLQKNSKMIDFILDMNKNPTKFKNNKTKLVTESTQFDKLINYK